LEQPLDPQKVLVLAARYDVELDFGSIPDLIKEHGVRFPSKIGSRLSQAASMPGQVRPETNQALGESLGMGGD
jgi:hypothetical protein